MILFENWIDNPFSKARHEPKSAINLAELYWQGLDPDLSFLLKKRMRFDLFLWVVT